MDEEYRRYMVEQSKRYMQHIRSLNHSVRMLKSEMDELRDMAAGLRGVDYSRPSVSTSPSPDAIPDALARIESIMDEYRVELGEFLDEQATAHRCLAELDGLYAALLTYRYIEGMPWADVAASTGYSEEYAKRELHEAALVAIYPFLPRMWRDPIHPAI